MTDGQASISTGILERYAADAALAVEGVRGLVGRRGVRIRPDGRFELHVCVEWEASIPEVGHGVQARVREYLDAMAGVGRAAVDVVVDEVGPAR
ncbi:MAG TPA: Asp23/Gls24 family envelope stress response protein [Gaiellaceae bacterium]|nr:Asp23/Gls24 family envelope stress response protein [Gaiellaceae bacterium]